MLLERAWKQHQQAVPVVDVCDEPPATVTLVSLKARRAPLLCTASFISENERARRSSRNDCRRDWS